MLIVAYVALALCIILAVAQCGVVIAFLMTLHRHRRSESPATRPKAAVILSMRGPDPFLEATLEGLLTQEYPNYEIHLIVDSKHDPVLQDIERALASRKAQSVIVSILEDRHATCSLKCSALIQAVRSLSPECEVVAFCDGDAPPHKQWLSDLVTPLSDPRVGASTGNRWFVPTADSWGSLVRYMWNIGGVVQVWLNGIGWAGSMAMRIEVIEKVELLSSWSRSLSVDAAVFRQMRDHGLRIQFVPNVIMINHERISLPQFVSWVQRQLVAARSCGSGWRLVALHGINLAGTQLLALGTALAGWAAGNEQVMWMGAIGIGVYWGSSMLAAWATEWGIRRITAMNGKRIGWQQNVAFLLLPAMLLTQVVYPIALGRACYRRRVSWRGIEYDIRGAGHVMMLQYRPYRAPSEQTATESIV